MHEVFQRLQIVDIVGNIFTHILCNNYERGVQSHWRQRGKKKEPEKVTGRKKTLPMPETERIAVPFLRSSFEFFVDLIAVDTAPVLPRASLTSPSEETHKAQPEQRRFSGTEITKARQRGNKRVAEVPTGKEQRRAAKAERRRGNRRGAPNRWEERETFERTARKNNSNNRTKEQAFMARPGTRTRTFRHNLRSKTGERKERRPA